MYLTDRSTEWWDNVIVPFEQGIAKAGEWLANRSDELVQIRTLLAENSALKEQVASLTEEKHSAAAGQI